MRSKIRRIHHLLTLLLLMCLGYLLWYRWDSLRETEKNRELQKIAWQTAGTSRQKEQAEEMAVQAADPDTGQADGAQPQAASSFAAGFTELVKLNPDLKAWISIPGTLVSLPIVQGEDNSFYLNHDFYGARDRHGTIFADCGADLGGNEPNVILYGHNMRDGSMFGSLKEYRDEDYYEDHPSFFLYLPEETREYEILAVLENDIFAGVDDAFQYYEYRHITDREMFETYYRYIKERSLYDTGVEAGYTDQLVTLCTCSYGSLDQRFLIVGRLKRETVNE